MERGLMNLVMLPLEGVSQTLFWQYREAMPAAWRLFEQSVSFRRFYTASTSAFQSFCDVVHGNSSELDHNLSYPNSAGCLLGQAENMFAILADAGYATMGVQHGEIRPDYIDDNYYGIWPASCGEFRWHGHYDSFYEECRSFLVQASSAKKPFALYCCDRASNLADNCQEKRENPLFHERLSKGFSLLDGTIGKIMEILESLSLLGSTLVVLYGPYGMDTWKHGISGGKTRAMEPYADVCWTPLILHSAGGQTQSVDGLASSIDLKATILGLLFSGKDFGNAESPSSGVNLLATGRNVAFTQNLFAMERENEGPAKGLCKSYAATDGDQRLIVSSDGGITGDGGMELYFDVRDPGNTRSLLDFFTLDQDGNMVSFGRRDIVHPHFTQSFKPHLVQSIITSYNAMRGLLRFLVKDKEEKAMAHCVSKSPDLFFDDKHFTAKRRWR